MAREHTKVGHWHFWSAKAKERIVKNEVKFRSSGKKKYFSLKVALVSGRGQYFAADQTSNFHKTVNRTTQLAFYENPYNKE
jgi:hypothetical protein